MYDKSFKISQLLSHNSLKETLQRISIKHTIKNEKTKLLYDEKIKKENALSELSNKLFDEDGNTISLKNTQI